MTNEQILKKAIEKAIKNGWSGWVCPWEVKGSGDNWGIELNTEGYDPSGEKTHFIHYLLFIFSHEFAKAFWGISLRKPFPKTETWWKYYLQQMVLEEDPIKYLEQFL